MSMGKFHHSKLTVEAQEWCQSCGKLTFHRIDDGRRGPCLNPQHGRQRRLIETAPPVAEQDSLFPIEAPRKDRG